RGPMRFATQRPGDRTPASRRRSSRLTTMLTDVVRALRGRARTGRHATFRRTQRHAGASRLRQPDRDGLLRRARAVLPLANVMHLFANELARCGGWLAAATQVSFRSAHGVAIRHVHLHGSELQATYRRRRRFRHATCTTEQTCRDNHRNAEPRRERTSAVASAAAWGARRPRRAAAVDAR